MQYQIYPRIDKLDCRTDVIGGGSGPTAQAQRKLLQEPEAGAPSSNAKAKLGLVCNPFTLRFCYLQEGQYLQEPRFAWCDQHALLY